MTDRCLRPTLRGEQSRTTQKLGCETFVIFLLNKLMLKDSVEISPNKKRVNIYCGLYTFLPARWSIQFV